MDASRSQVSDELTQKIIGAAIEVHKNLGPGLLESIYEEALCYEFELRGIRFQRQVSVAVTYKERVIKGQRIDIIVEGEVIIELKSVSKIQDLVMAQILSYLKTTGLKRGLIINFGESGLWTELKESRIDTPCALWLKNAKNFDRSVSKRLVRNVRRNVRLRTGLRLPQRSSRRH